MKKAAIFILIFSLNLFAQDADKLLRNLQETFSAINDFTAEIKQEGDNPVFTGKLFYKKENKFRLELKNMTIVSDGETIWNYNKKDNRVVVDDVRASESVPFSFETLLNEYPSKSNLSSRKEGNRDILILTPKTSSELNFREAAISVNSENLIEKISINNGNNRIVINISGYSINKDLPDSRFNFKTPEGSKIIDLR
jgi:outer membrane lipoprotein carrier protein